MVEAALNDWDLVYAEFKKCKLQASALPYKSRRMQVPLDAREQKICEKLYSAGGRCSEPLQATAGVGDAMELVPVQPPMMLKRFNEHSEQRKQLRLECELLSALSAEIRQLLQQRRETAKDLQRLPPPRSAGACQFVTELDELLQSVIDSSACFAAYSYVLNTYKPATVRDFCENVTRWTAEQQRLMQERAAIGDFEVAGIEKIKERVQAHLLEMAAALLVDEELPQLAQLAANGLPAWVGERSIRDDIFKYLEEKTDEREVVREALEARTRLKAEVERRALKNFAELLRVDLAVQRAVYALKVPHFAFRLYSQNIIDAILQSSWYLKLGLTSNLRYRALLRQEIAGLYKNCVEELQQAACANASNPVRG